MTSPLPLLPPDITVFERGWLSSNNILNTHLHSDHCGGNAALQAAWPGVPPPHPGQADGAGAQWDAGALSYTPTGQDCPPLSRRCALAAGHHGALGGADLWQVHAAPGHDPHSVCCLSPPAPP
jgi:glyoxylase-like metal-dependent hydrolase (beta-lactamase superfamily II)